MTYPKLRVLNYTNFSLQSLLLLLSFIVAIILRLAVGGVAVTQSSVAGLIFAFCLISISFAAGLKTTITKKSLVVGALGGLFLLVPAFFAHRHLPQPYGNYLNWAVVVSIVAFAEEAFLRGVLYDAVEKWQGEIAAIFLAAIAFTALHIPLYGWYVVPLDFAVGLFFGAVRSISGSWVAPAVAHTLADLAGWWL